MSNGWRFKQATHPMFGILVSTDYRLGIHHDTWGEQKKKQKKKKKKKTFQVFLQVSHITVLFERNS